MADNTTLNSGTGGDVIRDKDRTGVKTPITGLDLNPAGAESLMAGVMPVSDNAGSLTVDAPVGTPVFVRLSDGSAAIATLPVSLASLPTLAAGTNNIGDVDVLTTPGTAADNAVGLTSVAYVIAGYDGTNIQVVPTDSAGRLHIAAVNSALPAGTNTVGSVGLAPQTSGGHSVSRTISAASTNATSAKASAGQVYGWYLSNVNAAARYLKLYNKASAPTVGTDTPVLTVLIPGNAAGAGANVEFTNGIAFGTGIAYALTTGVTDADTGAVAANEIVVNLLYK